MGRKGLPAFHAPEAHRKVGGLRHCENERCENFWHDYQRDPLTVACDDACGAKDLPETIGDFEKAYEHWRFHSVMSGCSHGS